MRIWLDTDLGSDVDDALALGYALAHPDIEVVGVSTVFGDVELRTRMVERLLAIADAPPCPVVTGLGKPLTADRPGRMFGHEGQGLIDDAEPQRKRVSDPDPDRAIRALADALVASQPDRVVAIGPLTNIGALARAQVALPPLAIMGGKTTDEMLPGMIPQIGEWNWFCDPDATALVMGACSAASDALVVPAELTFLTRLEPEDIPALASGDPLCAQLAVLAEVWLDYLAQHGSPQPRVALHDPMTVAQCANPTLCELEAHHITAERDGSGTRGTGAPNCQVAVGADVSAVRAEIMGTLVGGAYAAPTGA